MEMDVESGSIKIDNEDIETVSFVDDGLRLSEHAKHIVDELEIKVNFMGKLQDV